METFSGLFVIFTAVAISDLISKWSPRISSTYFNLLFGIGIGSWNFTNQLVPKFDNAFFMLLVLAPLLFFEGQRTQILFVRHRIKQIIGSAFLLGIVSALFVTLIVSKMFLLTLPVGLIIVAICTPTDATALESVVHGRIFPSKIYDQLSMESLFNDATGLILLQAGIVWQKTGHLSFLKNTGSLLYSAGGGIVVGLVVSILITSLRQLIVRSRANSIYAQNLIYLMTPIVVYELAEKANVSAIIAVVVAGLVNNSEANRSRFSSPRQMHLGLELGDFLSNILSGSVFVILGLNLGRIFTSNYFFSNTNWQWLIIGISIYLLMIMFRGLYAKFINGYGWDSARLFAFGGVRGTVTLAMTFSVGGLLSESLYNQIVLIEVVVIVLSMLTPTIVFKLWLPLDTHLLERSLRQQKMRKKMVDIGIKTVNDMTLSDDVREVVVYDLQDQVQENTMFSFYRQWQDVSRHAENISALQSVAQRRALMQAFDAEREYLHSLALKHVVASDEIYDLYSEILLSESLVLDPENRLI
ncbi:MAG TPA: sodium:proton antiporter [Lactobacillus sp.]|nr:sodium:proton antiporter [Lactobacillus sp.]